MVDRPDRRFPEVDRLQRADADQRRLLHGADVLPVGAVRLAKFAAQGHRPFPPRPRAAARGAVPRLHLHPDADRLLCLVPADGIEDRLCRLLAAELPVRHLVRRASLVHLVPAAARYSRGPGLPARAEAGGHNQPALDPRVCGPIIVRRRAVRRHRRGLCAAAVSSRRRALVQSRTAAGAGQPGCDLRRVLPGRHGCRRRQHRSRLAGKGRQPGDALVHLGGRRGGVLRPFDHPDQFPADAAQQPDRRAADLVAGQLWPGLCAGVRHHQPRRAGAVRAVRAGREEPSRPAARRCLRHLHLPLHLLPVATVFAARRPAARDRQGADRVRRHAWPELGRHGGVAPNSRRNADSVGA